MCVRMRGCSENIGVRMRGCSENIGVLTRNEPIADGLTTIATISRTVTALFKLQLEDMGLDRLASDTVDIPVYWTRGCFLNESIEACLPASNPWIFVNGVRVVYVNATRSIYVERGALRPPYFHSEWPPEMKLATLGYQLAVAYATSLDPDATEAIKTCMFPASTDRDRLFAAYIATSAIMKGLVTQAPHSRQMLFTIMTQSYCKGGGGISVGHTTNQSMARLGWFYATFGCPVTTLVTGSNRCLTRHPTKTLTM